MKGKAVFGFGLTKDNVHVVRLMREVDSLRGHLATWQTLYKSARDRANYWRENSVR